MFFLNIDVQLYLWDLCELLGIVAKNDTNDTAIGIYVFIYFLLMMHAILLWKHWTH